MLKVIYKTWMSLTYFSHFQGQNEKLVFPLEGFRICIISQVRVILHCTSEGRRGSLLFWFLLLWAKILTISGEQRSDPDGPTMICVLTSQCHCENPELMVMWLFLLERLKLINLHFVFLQFCSLELSLKYVLVPY